MHALIAPGSETITAVTGWIRDSGITLTRRNHNFSGFNDALELRLPVSQAEALFQTSFGVYAYYCDNQKVYYASSSSSSSAAQFGSTMEVADVTTPVVDVRAHHNQLELLENLPSSVKGHVTLIGGDVTTFPHMKSVRPGYLPELFVSTSTSASSSSTAAPSRTASEGMKRVPIATRFGHMGKRITWKDNPSIHRVNAIEVPRVTPSPSPAASVNGSPSSPARDPGFARDSKRMLNYPMFYQVQAGDSQLVFVVRLTSPTGGIYKFDDDNYKLYEATITAVPGGEGKLNNRSASISPYTLQLQSVGSGSFVCVLKKLVNYMQYSLYFEIAYQDVATGENVFVGDWSTHYAIPTQDKVPTFVKGFYNIPADAEGGNDSGSAYHHTQAIGAINLGEGGEGYYSQSDLDLFVLYNLAGEEDEHKGVKYHGANDPNNPDGETQLDIEWVIAMGVNIDAEIWRSHNDDFLPVLQAIKKAEDSDRPSVLSFSYGGPEPYLPELDKFNSAAKVLGAMGVSILVSSGDDGALLGRDTGCLELPSFPASSPYVTAVGATMLAPVSSQGEDGSATCQIGEVVCSIRTGAGITSGGGFSVTFDQPEYQQEAVKQYLAQVGSIDNSKRRAYPDVSFMGHSFEIILNGKSEVVDGTSASSPALAGVIALLNDARHANNMTSLGFLNPLLYQLHAKQSELGVSLFNDVTVGDNMCSAAVCCPGVGYDAKPGWDPATGLGTINFVEFAKQVPGVGTKFNGQIVPPSFPTSPDCSALDIPVLKYDEVSPIHPNIDEASGWMYFLVIAFFGLLIVSYMLKSCINAYQRSRSSYYPPVTVPIAAHFHQNVNVAIPSDHAAHAAYGNTPANASVDGNGSDLAEQQPYYAMNDGA